MKQLIAATTLAFAVTAAHAQTPESKMPEHIGFGSGAAVGAAVAGPVGVVVGGTLPRPWPFGIKCALRAFSYVPVLCRLHLVLGARS